MGGLIPEDIIDEISARADIVEVVQKYVPLQRAGSRWKACCPFHQEKTPSFVVNPASNTCHCFGCGKGGSVFKFIMEMENLSFPEAARLLARQYNVMIPEPEKVVFRNGEKPEKGDYNVRERLFLLHDKLASWFVSNLRNNRNPKASAYFETRHLTPEAASKFMVGASPDSWDALISWALQEGFTMDELKLAHLVSESSKTPGKFFDFFRNRLMFPIWDEQGRVVGFSARQIDPEQGGGKYVNSMESPIFKKSKLLYGLNFARKSIGDRKYAVICEGQMDVIAMHTAGVTNAIAPQGTAFGEDQAKMIKRCFFDGAMHVTLATDADNAGMKAAVRDAEILLPMGAILKVAEFPGGKDPDELLKNSGPEAVVQAVESACDFFEFLYKRITNDTAPVTPAEKAETAEKILKYIQMIDSEVAKESYLQWLADRLQLPVGTIRSEMSRRALLERKPSLRRYEENEGPSAPPPSPAEKLPDSMTDPHLRQAFAELLEVLLDNEKLTRKAAEDLPPEMMDHGPLAAAVEIVIESEMNGEWDQAPAMIARKSAASQMPCPELDRILADAGSKEEEAEKESVPENVPEEKNLSPEEQKLDEKVKAKIRALGLPTVDELHESLERKNRRFQKSMVARKTVKDCVRIIKKHFLVAKKDSLQNRIKGMPAGTERNKIMWEIVLLTRELMTLNNPNFGKKADGTSFLSQEPPELRTTEGAEEKEETGGEETGTVSEKTQENAAEAGNTEIAAETGNAEEKPQENAENSPDDYRERPPDDYQEEEPLEEEIELPEVLQ